MLSAAVRGPEPSYDHARLFKEPSTAIYELEPHVENDAHLLATSPYLTPSHLLDLSTLAAPDRLLAQALTVLQPVRSDYATCAYHEAFNWEEVLARLRQLSHDEPAAFAESRTFFVIAFRSRIPPTTDRRHLAQLDEASHEEANISGGLLKYWFGVPDAEGRNLATCVWREPADAQRGGRGPAHRKAVLATRSMYSEWKVEVMQLVIGAGCSSWQLEHGHGHGHGNHESHE